MLTRVRLEALAEIYPDWRIWLDDHGWHARRRAGEFMQTFGLGAPVFCVHADSVIELAAQLRWQEAADTHAPAGCRARILAPAQWRPTARDRARTA
jgi:hypothetical protein